MELTSELLSVKSVMFLLILTVFVCIALSWIFKPSKKFPPGPREWGTTWTILKAAWSGKLKDLAAKWAKSYGEITFVYNFGYPFVFLNSADVARRLLSSEKYKFLVADRFPTAATRIVEMNGKDLVFSKYDDIMRKKRRMFYNLLGIYGDGVAKFEDIVWKELERMFEQIDEHPQQDVEISNILARSLKVIIYILVCGERPQDPSITDTLEEYDFLFNSLSRSEVEFVWKYLPFVFKIPGPLKKTIDRAKLVKKQADELMYFAPKRTHVPGQPRGVTDHLLEYAKKPGYEWMETDEEHIIALLASLFLSAHLTSRAALLGIFLYLLNYPDVTKKIQKEIDHVIGRDRPLIEHKSRMPYTEATILEGSRLISQLPLSGFRRPSEDINFEGMVIPKDSMIIMNNWFYLHDENVWEHPWTFKPERFLDSEGQLLPADHQTRRNLIAFGIGARACPGEVFARSRIFLFITSILQRYDLLPPVDEPLTRAEYQNPDTIVPGITLQPKPYKCRVVRRH